MTHDPQYADSWPVANKATTHDPLCDWRPCTCPLDYDVPQRGHRISCPEYDCECDLIAKVRADERKKPE